MIPRTRGASAAALAIVCALVCAGQARAGVRIHTIDGRALEAVSCRIEEGVAHVEFSEGASFGFPASRIVRLETIADAPQALPAPPVAVGPVAAPVLAEPIPSRTDVAGTPPEEGPQSLDALIRGAAERHHLDPALLAAVIAVESGYRPRALSPRGAQGLMQLMPATARELAVKDPFDARQNIEAGAKYLRELLDRHDDSFVSALAAYNAGMGKVARYKGVPPYRETVQYIDRVLKRYASPAPPAGPAATP